MEHVRKSTQRNVDGQFFVSYFTSTRSFNKIGKRNFYNFYGAIKIFQLVKWIYYLKELFLSLFVLTINRW